MFSGVATTSYDHATARIRTWRDAAAVTKEYAAPVMIKWSTVLPWSYPKVIRRGNKMVRTGKTKVLRLVMAGTVAAMVAVTLLWWKAEPARSAATVPQGFTDTLIAQVNNPTAMAVAPDGRLFVAQKANNNVGKLRVIKNGQLLSKPFLKVSTDTQFFRGLLGVTLDPNFAQNRYVYVFYTAPSPTPHNRVSRFTANGDVAVSGSEKVVLNLPPLSSASGHYGGALRFGADGKLYVGVGDDTNPADAQSLGSPNGKVLRLNRDGSVPTDNPFYGGASADDAVWALGLRQPYSLDVLSGASPRMFVNDVGEDTWEEINEAASGANYGWPNHEGPATLPEPDPNYRDPLFYYGRGATADTGCSITGGAFYDPATARFPSEYRGDYFYADYCGGWIRSLDLATGTSSAFASGIVKPVDLELGENGSLYYLTWGSSSAPPSVHEIK
jgi:glucose/arabinose dehydrogenase